MRACSIAASHHAASVQPAPNVRSGERIRVGQQRLQRRNRARNHRRGRRRICAMYAQGGATSTRTHPPASTGHLRNRLRTASPSSRIQCRTSRMELRPAFASLARPARMSRALMRAIGRRRRAQRRPGGRIHILILDSEN
ncbi:hypothetical protein F511_46224 [Dorcoceras hygrometricum]|uniref:Uncharacterized protein n=1 Tax=Dorcoceras hygrometricum TaxID=472368 RepID=A0A2Z6ZU49_9LAMI|nr:hypothetical protein F511_46224 [Dorcoceras hygrometricum]